MVLIGVGHVICIMVSSTIRAKMHYVGILINREIYEIISVHKAKEGVVTVVVFHHASPEARQ